MEILLAITDLHEGADGSRTTLFHMRQVAREFARAVAALKSRLGKARKTSAWKFRNPSTRYDMEKEMGYEINEKLIYLRGEVAGQEAVIDRWKQAPAPRPPAQRRKSAPRQSPPMPGQGMFDF